MSQKSFRKDCKVDVQTHHKDCSESKAESSFCYALATNRTLRKDSRDMDRKHTAPGRILPESAAADLGSEENQAGWRVLSSRNGFVWTPKMDFGLPSCPFATNWGSHPKTRHPSWSPMSLLGRGWGIPSHSWRERRKKG